MRSAEIASIEISPDSALRTPNSAFLLHGVTGSGKTEIYLRAIGMALRMGKQAIALVPEISLTPQAVHRFASRFPGRVALIHSQLSPGQQFDEWRRIREGHADIVVGSRSAIFAPLPNLGLIVVDEEHEWAYKQDNPPRYHAREVALSVPSLRGLCWCWGARRPTWKRITGTDGRVQAAIAPDEGGEATRSQRIGAYDRVAYAADAGCGYARGIAGRQLFPV